jgi:predicted nucleic acid-binding protein
VVFLGREFKSEKRKVKSEKFWLDKSIAQITLLILIVLKSIIECRRSVQHFLEVPFIEYESVMQRDAIQKQCLLHKEEQKELFYAFISTCKYNEIFYLWRPNLQDKDDDFIIELAVASHSEVIITENKKDIVSGNLHFDFDVQTPKDFLQRYTA